MGIKNDIYCVEMRERERVDSWMGGGEICDDRRRDSERGGHPYPCFTVDSLGHYRHKGHEVTRFILLCDEMTSIIYIYYITYYISRVELVLQ